MRRKRHTGEQIIRISREVEAGSTITEVYRRHGISEQSFFRWRKNYGGMEISEAKRLRELEAENRRLKHIVADQVIEDACLIELL